jgi:hypothetical protein
LRGFLASARISGLSLVLNGAQRRKLR